jgi:hypothetical protein
VLKQPIKPHQAHNIYLTKEQQLQEKVDWLVKDSKACDTMCEWWTFDEFKVIFVQMLQKKNTRVKPHYLDVWLHVHDDDEAKAEKLVSNNIKCYA